jgi:hypothetical protein
MKMNVLIIDTDKIALDVAAKISKEIENKSGSDDWIAIPKGIDIMQDISVDWMKMIRDRLDEKIRALESDVN